MKRLIVDIEANGLDNPTTIWCICTRNYDTGETRDYTILKRGYLDEAREYLADATEIIGHNFLGYDRPVLARLGDIRIPVSRIVDTLVLSRLYSPVREGGHSLERWAHQFGLVKQQHDEWDRFSPAMLSRCRTDVEINSKMYTYLQNEGRRWSDRSRKLEHQVTYVLGEMEKHGVAFNEELAVKIAQETYAKTVELAAAIKAEFPRLAIPYGGRTDPTKSIISPRATKDGSLSVVGLKWLTDEERKSCAPDAPFSRIFWQEFNLGSPSQIVERMNRAGWKPVEFTKAGTPKVSEANFETLPDEAPQEAKLIKDYAIANSRYKTIQTWLKFLKPDGRIHGRIFSIGAITHRCAHRDPNTANIPGVKDKMGRPNPWGPECRACWTVADPQNRRLVGVDAKGIQLRVLAHLMGDPEFTDIVLNGDPHQYNADKAGITRAQAKRFIYAWLLGAQSAKVGQIIERSKSEGQMVMDRFLREIPALARVKAQMKEYAKRGWFPAPDGRYIPIKSEHYALAVALQGVESIIMKRALVRTWNDIKTADIDAMPVLFVHDEFQFDTHKDCAEATKNFAIRNIQLAGEDFNLRCPMDGDGRIGLNWNDTH